MRFVALSVVALFATSTLGHDAFAAIERTKKNRNPITKKSRNIERAPIVIVLPAEGKTKALVDGYTLDSTGTVRNADKVPVAILTEKGIFTTPQGQAYPRRMQFVLLGLLGVGLDFTSTTSANDDAATRSAGSTTSMSSGSSAGGDGTRAGGNSGGIASKPAKPVETASNNTSGMNTGSGGMSSDSSGGNSSVNSSGSGTSASTASAANHDMSSATASGGSSGSTGTHSGGSIRANNGYKSGEESLSDGDTTKPESNRNDLYRKSDADSVPTTSVPNSVEEMIRTMNELNDGVLLNVPTSYGFSKHPVVVMGNDPRNANLPDWAERDWSLDPNTYWNRFIPWFVVFEDAGNESYNVGVEIRNLRIYTLQKSDGKWVNWGSSARLDGNYCPQDSNMYKCEEAGNLTTGPDGGSMYMTRQGRNMHGWWDKGIITMEPANIKAVHVSVQARLVGDATALAKARYMMQVGADYYPAPENSNFVLPGIGLSRTRWIPGEWTTFTMSTLSDTPWQEPGGGITAAEFRANPPPLD